MNKVISISIVWFVVNGSCAFGQYPANDLYQYHHAIVSPVFAGLEGQKLAFIGSTFQASRFPGEDSGFMGFETKFDKINSGAGFNAMVQQRGALYATFLSLAYNYHWKVNDEEELVFGAKLGVNENVVDYSQYYIPIDNFDPILDQSSIVSSTNLMTGVGVMYKRKRLFAGVSVDNIKRRQQNSVPSLNYDPAKVLVNYFAGTNVDLGKKISTTHSVYAYTMGENLRVDLNNSVVFRKWLIAGVSFQYTNTPQDFIPKANAGVSIRDRAKILVALYSAERDVKKNFSGQLMLEFGL